MAHAQKPDFVFLRNRRVHLNRRGLQFSWLLAVEVYATAVVMLDTPYSEVVWRLLVTHSIRQVTLHLPSHASPCAITFELDSTILRLSPFTSCKVRNTGFPHVIWRSTLQCNFFFFTKLVRTKFTRSLGFFFFK